MAEELNFDDPLHQRRLSLRLVPSEQLEAIEHQRKPRPAHVESLVSSMQRIGFIVPVVAVEHQQDGEAHYVVIDGQHRLEAARTLGLEQLPVIVVPAELAQRMMSLNVEKDLNIRERASVALGIYRTLMQVEPELNENEPEVVDSIERAYYVTLGIAYDKGSRLAGSAFEPLLKKCDTFLAVGIGECYTIREKRADAVLEANELIRQVVEEAKNLDVWHQYFQYQLISYVDPYKRKRGPADFDDFFGKVLAKLTELSEEPDGIHKVVRSGS
jgi:ParB family transcriptional regulator, chromosome partitioning protein